MGAFSNLFLGEDKRQIIKVIKDRGVESIIHFTNVENISSIVSHGLITKDKLKKSGVDFFENDTKRLDCKDNNPINFPDAIPISLSVSFPNYKMFFQARKYDDTQRWAVLEIDPIIIIRNKVAFCRTNAANKSVSCIPYDERKTAESFEQMFYELGRHTELPVNYTTDPQAEILSYEDIETEYIKTIYFNKAEVWSHYQKMVTSAGIVCKNDDKFFKPRIDYKNWKSEKGEN